MPARRTTTRPSDRAAFSAWWPTLETAGFLALPPPGPGRQDPADAETEARATFAARGLPADGSFACLLARSMKTFNRAGELTGPLPLHWGGDHAVVRAALGAGPSGYTITDSPDGGFAFDRASTFDADGLPDPDDPVSVRVFLAELGRRDENGSVRPLLPVEADWLHERLADLTRLDTAGPYIDALDTRGALTRKEIDRLLTAWRVQHHSFLVGWRGSRPLLRALLRVEHPEAWNVAAGLGVGPSVSVLAEVPSKPSLDAVRTHALAGNRLAVGAWLRLRRALHETDPVEAAAAIAAELSGRDDALRSLVDATRSALVSDQPPTGDPEAAAMLAGLRLALDERLPRPARAQAAQLAREWTVRIRESSTGPGAAFAVRTGRSTEDVRAELDRFDAAAEELMSGTGPDLTGPEGRLGDIWHRFRVLTDTDVAWLRARIADPAAGMRELAVSLELLYSHGLATAAEVDALVPRWRSVLAKAYSTTYTEWRHPMVVYTCLARDLGHPVAAALEKWWAKPAPKWKEPLRPLTWLGAPDEDGAARLWAHVSAAVHDTGHLMTWVLMRARLDGVPPLHVAVGLLGSPHVRDSVARRVLIGVADPAQPLWHYDIDPRSWSWWHRIVQVAEGAGLEPLARAIARPFVRQVAQRHHLVRDPDEVTPKPTTAEIVAAVRWMERPLI